MTSRIRTHLVLSPLLGALGSLESAVWQPRVDVYEMDDALFIQVEAPGLSVEDLELHFESGKLTVEGMRVRPPLPAPARAALVEMNYGTFQRVIPLPPDALEEGIKANYDAGILQILVRRSAKEARRRVAIEIG